MEKWHDKIAVVTKANELIGAACCKALVDNGMIVVGIGKHKNQVEKIRRQWPHNRNKKKRLHAVKSNMETEGEIAHTIENILKKFGTISVFVNSAGIIPYSRILEQHTEEELVETVHRNMFGVSFCNKIAFEAMSVNEGHQGYLIVINSIPEYYANKNSTDVATQRAMYISSNLAIKSIIETYRSLFEKKKTKVKVTDISPGPVRTAPELQAESCFLLEPSDIVDAVIYCLKSSPRALVQELTIEAFKVY